MTGTGIDTGASVIDIPDYEDATIIMSAPATASGTVSITFHADTETGSYIFPNTSYYGEMSIEVMSDCWIPTENEWYKAAYFDPSKSGGAGYWQYPGKGYTAPAANLSSDTPREAGSFTKAVTAFGTFDQGGNQWEYNEASFDGKVGLRGGSWYINDNEGYMDAATRYDVLSAKWPNYGFRVVALGEAAK